MRCPAKLAASLVGLATVAAGATLATVLATTTTPDRPAATTVAAHPAAHVVTRPAADREGRLSDELASALGCDRLRMRSAITETRHQVSADRDRAEAADVLAGKLATRPDRVRAAREFVRAVHRGQSRTQLVERLTGEVRQGRLDDHDKTRMIDSFDHGAVRPLGATG